MAFWANWRPDCRLECWVEGWVEDWFEGWFESWVEDRLEDWGEVWLEGWVDGSTDCCLEGGAHGLLGCWLEGRPMKLPSSEAGRMGFRGADTGGENLPYFVRSASVFPLTSAERRARSSGRLFSTCESRLRFSGSGFAIKRHNPASRRSLEWVPDRNAASGPRIKGKSM